MQSRAEEQVGNLSVSQHELFKRGKTLRRRRWFSVEAECVVLDQNAVGDRDAVVAAGAAASL